MRLVFPCCIAAISSVFDLKNASPLFLSLSLQWWWLTLQHALQKSSLMLPTAREREQEREKREMCSFMWLQQSTCSSLHVCYLLCLCARKNTCTHQYSHWFPKGPARFAPLSLFDMYLSSLLSDLQPFIYIHPMHLISIKIKWNVKLWNPINAVNFSSRAAWKGVIYRLSSWSSNRRLASSVQVNIVWHSQRCWSPACTCCGAAGWLPPGFYFSGNGKRAKRPSVINNHICAAQNMLACRHFLTHGPTGWELHNRSAKLLILILNCFGSFIVCKCGSAMRGCQVGSLSWWVMNDFIFWVVYPATGHSFSYLPCPLVGLSLEETFYRSPHVRA